MRNRDRLLAGALLLPLTFGSACSQAQTKAKTSAGNDAATTSDMLSADELGNLVAPIALYPDVLIAQILPAMTFPTDVVMAARWVRSKPDMAELDQKPWDESVKALCRYPDVLFKLDEDLDWTNALGAAFLAQGEDVMNAIQAGREKAKAQGILKTNEQQTIVVEQETVRIVPTQANVVYVPQYNPQVIYVEHDDGVNAGTAAAASAISFGAGVALGAWLNMDCNWSGHAVHYCQPGHYGGWSHSGAVVWGNNAVAGVGPRGAFAVGQDRGFVAGPRGAAAWGPNGGAAWRRPSAAAPLPAFSGRYSGYGNRYGGRYGSNNQINVNRNINNVNRTNIDRGDRTSVGGGSRTNGRGGDRTGQGLDQRPGRSAGGGAQQLPANRPGGRSDAGAGQAAKRPSAFDGGAGRSEAGAHGQRGKESRSGARSGASAQRPSSPSPKVQPSRSNSPQRSSSPAPRAKPSRSSSSSRSSAFSSGQGKRQAGGYSSRGASSRGGGGRRGGGRR